MQVVHRNLLPDGHSKKEDTAPYPVAVLAMHRVAAGGGKWSSITPTPPWTAMEEVTYLKTHPSKMSPIPAGSRDAGSQGYWVTGPELWAVPPAARSSC